MSRWFTSILLSVLVFTPAHGAIKAGQRPRFELKGVVLDEDGHGLPEVKIKVYDSSTGQPIGLSHPDANGRYSFTFTQCPSIRVDYLSSEVIPEEIPNLSGARLHDIGIIMIKPSKKRPLAYDEAIVAFATFQSILRRERSNNVKAEDIQKEYGPILKKMQVPDELKPNLDLLRSEFNIGEPIPGINLSSGGFPEPYAIPKEALDQFKAALMKAQHIDTKSGVSQDMIQQIKKGDLIILTPDAYGPLLLRGNSTPDGYLRTKP